LPGYETQNFDRQHRDGDRDRPLVVSNPILAASVLRLAAESHSWRDGIAAVAATGRRAVLVTSDEAKRWIDPGTLAQLHPLSGSPARLDSVLIVVNLELLQKTIRAADHGGRL
jgi:hypothetical protein